MSPVLLAYLAASSGGGGVDLSILGQYGVLGVFAGILLWYTRGSIEREKARSDKAEAKVDELNTMIRDKVLPAALTATAAVNDSNALLAEMKKRSDEAAKATETIQAARSLLADMQYRADAARQASEAAEEAKSMAAELADARKKLEAETAARKRLERGGDEH